MKQLKVTLLWISIIVLAGSIRLDAQSMGAITGMVHDPSGAVVPSTIITAHQIGGGVIRSTRTTSAGVYSLPALPIGSYRVTAEASGFKRATIEISLDVNQTREVDFTLGVAAQVSKVVVTASPPLLDTQNPTLGALISGEQVVTLPLNGRSLNNLVLLQPGTTLFPGGAGVPSSNSPSGVDVWVASNGTRGDAAAGYVDGMDVTDNEFGGVQLTNFNLDAVDQVKILQSDYSAQYGRGAGSVLLIATKAGTDQFHGSLFDFLRNSAFDSRSFFSATVSPLERNQFGGDVGGPIIKNRTFFFFQYAGFRQESGPPFFLAVPTELERQGDVPIVGANGQPDTLVVPVNPNAATVLNKYPLPNDPTGPDGDRTYLGAVKTPFSENQFSVRIDNRISDRDSMFGRFTYSNNGDPVLEPTDVPIDPAWSASSKWNTRNLGLSETHAISPTLLNVFTASWDRELEGNFESSVAGVTDVGFTDSFLSGWGPYRGGFQIIPDSGVINDTLDWVKGSHTLNIGAEYRTEHVTEFGAGFARTSGLFDFEPGTPVPFAIPSASGNNNLSAGAPSPNSLVSLLVGAPATYSIATSFPGFGTGFSPEGLRQWHMDGWVQDDIRATHNLTVNLGLRYEYNSVPYEMDDRLATIDDNPNSSAYHYLVLNPQPLWYPDYRGFGPRLGLAYRVNDKTVLRSGFGIYTNEPYIQIPDQSLFNFPFSALSTITMPPFTVTPLALSLPTVTALNGTPLPPNGNTKAIPPNTPINLTPVAKAVGTQTPDFVSSSLHNGYIISANASIQRQLPGNVLLEGSYVATNGVGLFAWEWPNGYAGAEPQYSSYTVADPGLGNFELVDNHAHSTYNALEVLIRKNSPQHGLQFEANYTYSKEIDNASDTEGDQINGDITGNNPFCWSCEKSVGMFDVPQRFAGNVIYELPFNRLPGPSRLTHGWQVAAIPTIQSGFPFTITDPFGTVPYGKDNLYGTQATRPNLLQTPPRYSGSAPQYFTNAVIQDGVNLGQVYFGTPGALTTGVQTVPGNLGRNTFRSPSWSDVDFALYKNTHLTERITLQFRSEFFNGFNLAAFAIPGSELKTTSFGKYSSTEQTGREIQFALRLIF